MDAVAEREFREYVAARQGALYRIALLLTGHREDAEDLVQIGLTKRRFTGPASRGQVRLIRTSERSSITSKSAAGEAVGIGANTSGRTTRRRHGQRSGGRQHVEDLVGTGARANSTDDSVRSWFCATTRTCPRLRSRRSSAAAWAPFRSQNHRGLARLRALLSRTQCQSRRQHDNATGVRAEPSPA